MPSFVGLILVGGIFTASLVFVGGRDGVRCFVVFGGSLLTVMLSAMCCARIHGAAPIALALCVLICLALNTAGFLPTWRLRKVALAGGGLALIATFLVGMVGVWQLKLTGAYNASLRDVWYGSGTRHIPQHLVVLGLIVLTGVGAVADLAVAVTAVMAEIRAVRPGCTRSELAAAGMRLGGDVTGTELNTLVYAMLGMHFGAVLLPFARPDVRETVIPWLEVANRQSVAVEVLAALAGTAGLLLAIPMTAWVGALILIESETS